MMTLMITFLLFIIALPVVWWIFCEIAELHEIGQALHHKPVEPTQNFGDWKTPEQRAKLNQ